MRVYVAAPWPQRQHAADVAGLLAAQGHVITHDWWNKEAADDDYRELRRHAENDFRAVRICDLFVLLNLEKSEGKAVETGIALSDRRILLVGVGPRYSNIFHHLPDWLWFPTPLELLQWTGAEFRRGTAVGTTPCSHASASHPATEVGNPK